MSTVSDQLSESEQRALLAELMQGGGRGGPLAHGQRALWALDQMHPGTPAYNLTSGHRISGPLDADTLRRSIDCIVGRHESLRTIFLSAEGKPVQIARKETEIAWSVVDLEHLPPARQEVEVEELIASEARRSFSLSRGPLIRPQLVRLSSDRHILVLGIHHIVCDAWSLKVLYSELARLYPALRSGLPSPVSPPPSQYLDYARAQVAWCRTEDFKSRLAYWREHLTGPLPMLELPGLSGRPRTYDGGIHAFGLSATVIDKARAVGRQLGTTLFVVLLAAFRVLLFRRTGQKDLVVGVPTASRHRPGAEEMIGFFINTLPLRLRLDPDESFRSVVVRTSHVMLRGLEHEEVPLQSIIHEIGPSQSTRPDPFQALFNLTESVPSTFRIGDLQFKNLAGLATVETGKSKFDLSLTVTPVDETAIGVLEYSTDVLTRAGAAGFAEQYLTLLEEAVLHIDRAPSGLRTLRDDAERALMAAGCHPRPLLEDDVLAHDLFERSVAAAPQAVAIVAGSVSLTYEELNAQANALARRLRSLGVRSESIVGLFIDRSVDLVIAMLGVLKAGGVFLPLDPNQPRLRLEAVLHDSGMTHVVTGSAAGPSLPSLGDEVCRVHANDRAFEAGGETSLDRSSAPDHGAYVIFTSGSHGSPKGVLIEHRSLSSFVRAGLDAYGWRSTDRVLQFAAPTFDAAIEEIFLTLSCGACLVLRTPEMLDSVEDFLQSCMELGISVLDLPTAYFRELASTVVEAGLTLPRSVRQVIIGGESAPVDLVKAWRKHVDPTVVLLNTYGPTEATVVATCFDTAGLAADATEVPIGRPLQNAHIYIVDALGHLLPPGSPGEICIAGPCVARGYVGGAQSTEHSFVPIPWLGDPGARMYKTGDFGFLRDDGELVFIGRRDDEVKIRGFRVVLTEVESTLSRIPAVGECVVLADDRGNGAVRLIAHYTLASGAEEDASRIRAHAAELLPDYLVPSIFNPLRSIPRLSSGKPDRRALSSLPLVATTTATPQKPQSAEQNAIAEIWSKVLGVASVGIDDNYFELGGDSITALQIVSQCRRVGIDLRANDILEHQTIASLTTRPRRHENAETRAPGDSGPWPLTPIQLRFLATTPPEHRDHYNQWLIWSPPRILETSILKEATHAVIDRHPTLRAALEFAAGQWQQMPVAVSDRFFVVVEGDEPTWNRRLEEMQTSLDLARGDLVRVAFWHGDDRPRVALIVHHVAIDVVSWQVFLQDLGDAYDQRLRGQEVRLPAPTTHIGDWARHLSELARSDEARASLQYWGAGAALVPARLKSDRDDGVDDATAWPCTLSPRETLALRQAASELRVTVEECCVAAVARAIREAYGSDDVLLDIERHGRNGAGCQCDLSRSIGWFTNLFPVALQLARPDARGALDAVCARLRAAPEGGLLYGAVRYLGAPELAEQLARLPQAEVSFNFLGNVDSTFGAGSTLRLSRPCVAAPTYVLDVIGALQNDRLNLLFVGRPSAVDENRGRLLVESSLRTLRELAVRPQEPGRRDKSSPVRALGSAGLMASMQRRILVDLDGQADTADYHVQMLLESRAETGSLRPACERLMMRHSALRSCFRRAPIVLEELEEVPDASLRRAVADDPSSLDRVMAEDLARPFDPELAPLLRLLPIGVGGREYVLLSYHHLILDGWSSVRVLDEFRALCENPAARLPSPGVSPMVLWQWLATQTPGESSWRPLVEAKATWPFGVGAEPRSRGASSRGESELVFSHEQSASIRRAAKTHRVTMASLLQAAWACVLAHHSGTAIVGFGMVDSGRPDRFAGSEHLVGMLCDVLPFTSFVDEEQEIGAWLKSVQRRQTQLRSPVSWDGDSRRRFEAELGVSYGSVLRFSNYPSGTDDQHGSLRLLAVRDQWHFPVNVVVLPGNAIAVRVDSLVETGGDRLSAELARHLSAALEALLDPSTRRVADVLSAISEGPRWCPLPLRAIPSRASARHR